MGIASQRLGISHPKIQNSGVQEVAAAHSFILTHSLTYPPTHSVTVYLHCAARPTSIVDVSEGRVDELTHVARAFGNVQQHRDGVVAAIA